jgi:hypothetical protein
MLLRLQSSQVSLCAYLVADLRLPFFGYNQKLPTPVIRHHTITGLWLSLLGVQHLALQASSELKPTTLMLAELSNLVITRSRRGTFEL